jgi:predicted acetyltransferase
MRPVDEPLRLLLRDSRGVRGSLYDSLWIRLVDARAALAARRYATSGTIVFEVRDEQCAWNRGQLRIESTIEGATCATTTARADLALDISDLAAVYLGANHFQTLLRAGRIAELTPRAADRADALFFSDRAPWCPTHF